MLSAVIWGVVQGLTEFLPVSSSGHLVIVPAALARLGVELTPPSLAVSAVLHLGTLVAVLVYFRSDIAKVLRMRSDPEGRRLAALVGVGTIPALLGLPLADTLEAFQDDVTNVGWALLGTGLILAVGQRFARGRRTLDQARITDAVVVGLAQALALIPGVSRSGATIAAGSGRGLTPMEAARFSFLLGIPAIAGGGLSQFVEVAGSGHPLGPLAVGMVVAGVTGYLAIAAFLGLLRRSGLVPFSIYCLLAGTATILLL